MHEVSISIWSKLILYTHSFRLLVLSVVAVELVINLFISCNSNVPFRVLGALLEWSQLSILILQRNSSIISIQLLHIASYSPSNVIWIAVGAEIVRFIGGTTELLSSCLVPGHFLDLRDGNVIEMLHDSLVLLKDICRFGLILANGTVWTNITRGCRLLTGLSWLESKFTC